MSRRRYEILLPIRHNDGTLVDPDKHLKTHEELVAAFGAVTTFPQVVRGVWVHKGERFEDEHLRVVVDVEATLETRAFFTRFKEQLKSRFQQIDIWIVSYEIELI